MQNCLLAEASTAPIVIDGNLNDWSAVGPAASVPDPAGDHEGDDPGADVLGSKVAYSDGMVYVLTELAGAPSTAFQRSSPPNDGSYRLTIQGYNGLSLQAELFYSPQSEGWELTSFTGGVTAEAGEGGIEWAADISSYLGEGFESVDFIMVEPRKADALDAVECTYFEL